MLSISPQMASAWPYLLIGFCVLVKAGVIADARNKQDSQSRSALAIGLFVAATVILFAVPVLFAREIISGGD